MSVLLSLMMLLSLLPTAVLADESATKTYTKVTSADELVTGEYVMVATPPVCWTAHGSRQWP